ncbi:MAG: hypothetical protein KatS3mg059_0969 [Thermomicrobiales bacterium]|nr:MAG: hypothetical protein KatS3mg059_0969 [Thermomicrobiales bacterium]
MRDEVYLAGGPETVARCYLQAARQALGIDLFLANIYAPAVHAGPNTRRMLHACWLAQCATTCAA